MKKKNMIFLPALLVIATLLLSPTFEDSASKVDVPFKTTSSKIDVPF